MSSNDHSGQEPGYEKGVISLPGAVALGSGVMIGAGVLAVTGQIAELAGALFPLAFVAAAVVSSLSAYSYIKLAKAYPSAGGIATFLEKCYGEGVLTGGLALLMYLSMVLNQSLVARTFGTYALQLFNVPPQSVLVPVLGVALLLGAMVVNLIGTATVERLSLITAAVKIGGLVVFAGAILWLSNSGIHLGTSAPHNTGIASLLGSVALGVLAYKGFTTITNQGAELVEPRKNVGRAIIISIAVCAALYLLVSLAVASQLTVPEIVKARDYALAQAARPFFGDVGLWFTVGFAVIATSTGVMVSVFAVSRMLAMLTKMELVPQGDFGMPGSVQQHAVVYTVAIAIVLTAVADLSRIASLGAIIYLAMDIGIHWGVITKVRGETEAVVWVPALAIVLDIAVLGGLVWVKIGSDTTLVAAAIAVFALVFGGEWLYLRFAAPTDS
ncbi:MAG: amino acid permease [Actinobacteria bacterium HGW-Actinobacteria-7]|jgi:amino acid transporter|nr:MAG: amino acid permease [Actinobacteria bacterium HGW-Actinobacteria-7]